MQQLTNWNTKNEKWEKDWSKLVPAPNRTDLILWAKRVASAQKLIRRSKKNPSIRRVVVRIATKRTKNNGATTRSTPPTGPASPKKKPAPKQNNNAAHLAAIRNFKLKKVGGGGVALKPVPVSNQTVLNIQIPARKEFRVNPFKKKAYIQRYESVYYQVEDALEQIAQYVPGVYDSLQKIESTQLAQQEDENNSETAAMQMYEYSRAKTKIELQAIHKPNQSNAAELKQGMFIPCLKTQQRKMEDAIETHKMLISNARQQFKEAYKKLQSAPEDDTQQETDEDKMDRMEEQISQLRSDRIAQTRTAHIALAQTRREQRNAYMRQMYKEALSIESGQLKLLTPPYEKCMKRWETDMKAQFLYNVAMQQETLKDSSDMYILSDQCSSLQDVGKALLCDDTDATSCCLELVRSEMLIVPGFDLGPKYEEEQEEDFVASTASSVNLSPSSLGDAFRDQLASTLSNRN